MSEEEEKVQQQDDHDDESAKIKEEIKTLRKELSQCQKKLNNACIRYGKSQSKGKGSKKKNKDVKRTRTEGQEEEGEAAGDDEGTDKGAKESVFECGGNPFSDPPTPCPGTDKNKGSSTKLPDGKVIQQCVTCKKAVTNTKRKEAKKAKKEAEN
jgi:hypothetical protein